MKLDQLTSTGVLYSLKNVTEAAVVACYDWIGKGQKEIGDGAAVDAMRSSMNELQYGINIVIGEGEKDNAPQLYTGEELGSRDSKLQFDVAVDPVEGTTYMAKGLNNALAVVAMTTKGAMMKTGSSYYMDKIAVGAGAKGVIDPTWSIPKQMDALAQSLNKNKEDLTIYVLEKPRHKKLIEELYSQGVRVLLYPAGDVAGALLSAIPDSPVDALYGTGGTPESILSAIAIKAMGGDFFARYDPQLEEEAADIAKEGKDTNHWFGIDELVTSDDVFFAASGLTDGLMLDGVQKNGNSFSVNTMLISNYEREIAYVKNVVKQNNS